MAVSSQPDGRASARKGRLITAARLAALVAFAALSARVVLPLVVICRTYQVRIGSCCASVPSYAAAHGAAPSRPCPFCCAISPFEHARFEAVVSVHPVREARCLEALRPPHFLSPAKELSSNPPRAPPAS